MTTQTEALKLALEALQQWNTPLYKRGTAITAIKEALAQPERHELQAKGEHPAPCARFCEANAFRIVERGYQRQIRELQASLAQDEQSSSQEPVEDVVAYHSDGTRTVRIAPKRPWVGLTDEDYQGMSAGDHVVAFWVDRILKDKNT